MDIEASPPPGSRQFEAKVRRQKLAVLFETAWRRLWALFGVIGAFALVSYAGIWNRLDTLPHIALLGLFGLGALAALIYVLRTKVPSRDEAIRLIERSSGIPHRPASSYEDTISGASGPTTQAIFAAHRARMAALIAQLKPASPQPRTDRVDPFALRAGGLLLLVFSTVLLGASARERIAAAFDFSGGVRLSEARLDAWIAPPAYTQRPPVMLADGSGRQSKPAAGDVEAKEGGKPAAPEVPERSQLIVRASGIGGAKLAVELQADGPDAKPQRIEPEAQKDGGDAQEVRLELRRTGTVRALAGGGVLAEWRVNVSPDAPPTISLSRPPELTPRGSLKITFRADDDFGVASGEVKLKKVPEAPATGRNSWAKAPLPTGPRWPLPRPPVLTLKLPKANAKEVSGHTYFELAPHPWAGQKVIMVLEAKDVAGQVGRSIPFEMTLPERQFTKPLARAVAEQRKMLLEDPRYRPVVMTALDALTLEPEGFITDLKIYLGLRSVYHRLAIDETRAGMRSVTEQLWKIALRIEDGDLSDAERRLKDAQDKLAKALENGASDEEIKQLMAELKQALGDYMKQMAEQNGQNGEQQFGQNPEQQALAQEDLERMMRNLEDMAKNGSREQAQQLLSEMQDLMERMQSGKMTEADQKKSQEAMKMMEELSNMVGEQQKLMDETFDERRGDGKKGKQQQGAKQKPPPGLKGMGGDGKEGEVGAPPGTSERAQKGRGQRGQNGEGQQAQQGQGDQMGEGGDNQGGKSGKSLSQRQRELRDRLGRLQKEMREKGTPGSGQQMSEAEEAMEGAEQALEEGELDEATDQQGRALDQMRQGAQSMAQEMMRNMPQRYGQGGDSPRDPLGRPQRSQGPDLGTSVKVPDQIDVQRAREILDELRRRLGETQRGATELDYLERLLKRF